MKELVASREDSYNMTSSINNRSKASKSPQKIDWMQFNASTPVISPFSPFPKESSQTVKKDMNGCE
jgi:hypothetical protein